ncbi:hypothetical protein ACMDCR_09400 [Labrys okinawensis]|uniref:hypothetical protein n=1 Tax=Labrys okinawensis TaxID=346911 RepID=UPI0039BD851C
MLDHRMQLRLGFDMTIGVLCRQSLRTTLAEVDVARFAVKIMLVSEWVVSLTRHEAHDAAALRLTRVVSQNRAADRFVQTPFRWVNAGGSTANLVD